MSDNVEVVNPLRNQLSWLWYSAIVSSVLATIFVTVVMLRDVTPSKAFTWHPILMCLSFLVCMSQGMNQFVGSRLFSLPDSTKSRRNHAMYQFLAFLSAIGGWSAIYVAHSHGKGHSAKGDPMLKVIHTWLGYFVLLGVTIQTIVGIMKYISLPRKLAKWHGALYAGPMIWFCGCVNIFLALSFWMSATYNSGVKLVASFCVVWTVSTTTYFKVYIPEASTEEEESLLTNTDDPVA
eukprot:CAMPEP_0172367872 /NCGR_PEP_ID=MMETSP1060-20121228/24190_1 /TAXON_ID=37318 /ORGANISM="Pseudo-nitzschia pungens, Strain cf. cingulata" /LENGTH=235 /DNA_ID=CAMNT_0013092271 /DNA_START=51 /DNA_END=758 /DNA_ORIENTATION=+